MTRRRREHAWSAERKPKTHFIILASSFYRHEMMIPIAFPFFRDCHTCLGQPFTNLLERRVKVINSRVGNIDLLARNLVHLQQLHIGFVHLVHQFTKYHWQAQCLRMLICRLQALYNDLAWRVYAKYCFVIQNRRN
jgi:hypothetical protein